MNRTRDWKMILALLPQSLEEAAKARGAFQIKREIQDASDLLRLLMAKYIGHRSFRETARWAGEMGLAKISDVSLIERFEKSVSFLEWLLAEKLSKRLGPIEGLKHRVRLVDATHLESETGQMWQIHMGFDLSHLKVDFLRIEAGQGGESFKQVPVSPGELLVGDRAYGTRSSIRDAVERGGEVLTRIKWNGLPVRGEGGNDLNLLALARHSPSYPVELAVWLTPLKPGDAPIEGRMLISKKPPEATEKAKQQVKRRASKRQQRLKPETLEAAEYLFLFTTLKEEKAESLLDLYRMRWQIELAFKRFKTIQGLDEMQVRKESLCRAHILTHCLAMILVEELMGQLEKKQTSPQLAQIIALETLSGRVLCPAKRNWHTWPEQAG